MKKGTENKPILNGEFHWAEQFLFAIMCVPKGTIREKVLEESRKHISGTVNGWILMSDEDVEKEGLTQPAQCPDFDSCQNKSKDHRKNGLRCVGWNGEECMIDYL